MSKRLPSKSPEYLQFLLDNKFLGNKSTRAFIKNERTRRNGRNVILALNLKTLEYEPQSLPNLPSLDATKQIDNLPKRIKPLFGAEDRADSSAVPAHLFAYVSNRVPEISDNLYAIDDAMKAGYAWEPKFL